MIDKRMLYSQGQRVTKSLDGSRPGYGGPQDWGDQAANRGAYSGRSTGSNTPGPGDTGGQGGGPQNNTGSASTDDRSSALQTYNTKKATGRLGRQDANQMDSTIFYGTPTKTNPSGMIDIGYQGPLNQREQAFQNFLDYRKPVKTYGLSRFFQKPIQTFSDFTASVNRPFFEKVIRAGKIPGLSFDMTQQQFEDAYQNYMSNRLAGKTDAYGNPLQGFEYGDDNVLTGGFQNDGGGGGGIMNVAVDDTTDDTTTDDELILRFLGADSTLDPAAAGLASTEELRNMLLERAKNLYT